MARADSTGRIDETYVATYSSEMATRIVPKTELRDRIREELAELDDDTLLVTDRGRPLAVAISVERWNQLQETVEDLQDVVSVLEHRVKGGRGRSAKSVLTEIEAEPIDVSRPHRKTS